MEQTGRILIVEGDPALMDVLAAHAESVAQSVLVTSVAEALKHLDTERIDVILCAWSLPDGSGLTVLRHAQVRSPNAMFVALTSRAHVDVLKADPSLEGYRIVPNDSSGDVLLMILKQGVALSRMRDSARINLPITPRTP